MVVWGATPIATRLALDDLQPLFVACARTVLAGLVAIPLLAAMRRGFPSRRRPRILLGVSAATGFVIFPIVYTEGQQRTSAVHGVMILAALPIFTGAYAALVARRRPTRAWILGSAVALAGEVVLIAGRGGSTSDATLAGDLLVARGRLCVSARLRRGRDAAAARPLQPRDDALGRPPRDDRHGPSCSASSPATGCHTPMRRPGGRSCGSPC